MLMTGETTVSRLSRCFESPGMFEIDDSAATFCRYSVSVTKYLAALYIRC